MENQITELQLQAQCAIWFQNNMRDFRGRFRRVKNETDHIGGTARSRVAQGVENRTTGIVKGTWDAFFVLQPIVWIEFKVGNGRLSPEQMDFWEMGRDLGWKFEVVYTLQAFQEIAKKYF